MYLFTIGSLVLVLALSLCLNFFLCRMLEKSKNELLNSWQIERVEMLNRLQARDLLGFQVLQGATLNSNLDDQSVVTKSDEDELASYTVPPLGEVLVDYQDEYRLLGILEDER